jgi:hypothetical protein
MHGCPSVPEKHGIASPGLPRDRRYVSRFSPACQGVDVAALAALAAEACAWLVNAQPQARITGERIPKIRLAG